METNPEGSVSANVNALEKWLNTVLVDKAPFQLPKGIKDFFVFVAPWIALIILILTLPIIFLAFGISFISLPFVAATDVTSGSWHIISLVLAAVQLIITAVALPGLFKQKKSAWNLLFYSNLISIISNLIQGSIISAIISAIISLYILFQIRSYYK